MDHVGHTFVGYVVQLWMMVHFLNTFDGGKHIIRVASFHHIVYISDDDDVLLIYSSNASFFSFVFFPNYFCYY